MSGGNCTTNEAETDPGMLNFDHIIGTRMSCKPLGQDKRQLDLQAIRTKNASMYFR